MKEKPAPQPDAPPGKTAARSDAALLSSDETARLMQARHGDPFACLGMHEIDGRIVKMVGISMDNTARKTAEQALRKSEEAFRALFELACGAIAYVDLDGSWRRVNDSLCQLLGYSEQELRQLTFQDLTHPDDLQANLEQLQLLLEGKISNYDLEKRLRCKDGHFIWTHVRTSLQRNSQDDSPEHLISVIDDITRERAERQALLARIEELERLLQGI